MRIGHATNGRNCEFEMQSKLKDWLTDKDEMFIDEFFVGEVGRRPDFLVLKPGNGLINIEAKCNDLVCLISQMRDNARYCDYSFAYIPDYCLTPKEFKHELLNYGFGLIIYNTTHKVITEVLEAHKNKEVNKMVRSNVIYCMKKALIMRKKKSDIDTQIKLNIIA